MVSRRNYFCFELNYGRRYHQFLYLQTNSNYEIKTSSIARGIAVGDELEFADEVTLGRSILNRQPFEESLKS